MDGRRQASMEWPQCPAEGCHPEAAKASLLESFSATDSIACSKLKDMLDINQGVQQRNLDGTTRLQDGKPTSAKITLAVWPEEALTVLREARDAYLASLEGAHPSARTDAHQDFSLVLSAWNAMRPAWVANDTFTPGEFPGSVGLSPGAKCNRVTKGS